MDTATKDTPAHKKNKYIRIAKAYGLISTTLVVLVLAYLVLIAYPQPLFGYSANYKHNFHIYSRDPLPPELETVLDKAEAKLVSSPLYADTFERRLFFARSHGMYAFLTNKAYRSFGSSIPFLDNVMLTQSDIAADRMFVDRPENNSRSLSGVIAHEVTHLLIRQRYGTVQASLMPTWKNEGYCEYIAGESTIPLDEGKRLWREKPADDMAYRYVKYHLMVKHLLEDEHMTPDDLFSKQLNEEDVANRTFAAL
jgi:hypothetical protein